MKKALIVADYSKDAGMGHLVRCGSLAKELSESFTSSFAALNDEFFPFVQKYAEGIGSTATAVDNLSHVGASVEADLVIIDSYTVSTKFLTDIKNCYDVCAVIDDNYLLPFYDVDFVINQNIGAESRKYHTRKDTELLLGPNYLMLREAFAKTTPIDIQAEVTNIVVTMGGSDVKNTTEKVLAFVERYKEYVFDVVVGPGFRNKNTLERLAAGADNIVLHYEASMPELFSKCQAAISACGSTIYELASMGVPTVGVVTADNQQNISIEMENGGIIVSAGLEEKLSGWYFTQLFEDIVKNKELREKMHNKQTSVVAKDGTRRIKEKLLCRF